MAEVAVIGAGSSGLAVLRAVARHGVAVGCFERGSGVGGLWRYQNANGRSSAYASLRTNRAVVVATGHDWCPRLPEEPDGFAGEVSHSHDYRTPEGFAGRRVLVVGAGQSAAEIAVEVAGWRRAPSSPCGPAPTWSRAGSAGGPTTPPTSSRSTRCRGRC